MKKILLADDEPRMRKLVSDFLKREELQIIEADDGKEAIDKFFDNEDIDLVILDVMMPVYDGWAVCRKIRKISKVPIIMLTARGDVSDELFGFELGADEYISKPFNPSILVARVKAILNRANSKKEIKKIELDRIVIEESARTIYLDNEIMELSPTEYELLVYLVKNKGIALSRDKILDSVWEENYFGDVRTVDTHIKNLRLKLKDLNKSIQTVRGYGYRFEVK